MSTDEQAIRDLVALWHRAIAAGDVDTVLDLMVEDVVFLVPGQPPMRGRDAFQRGLRGVLAQNRIESAGEVLEVEVSGSLAYCWATLTVRVIPLSGGDATMRAGNTLSIMRKQFDGSGLAIMLRRVADPELIVPIEKQGGTWDAFLWVDDAEALHSDFKSNGAEVVYGPLIQEDYRMNEFAIRDCDGHVLGFGAALVTPDA